MVGDHEAAGTYRALPALGQDILQFITRDPAGPVQQFTESKYLGASLARIDEELTGLSEAHEHLCHSSGIPQEVRTQPWPTTSRANRRKPTFASYAIGTP